MKKHKIEITKDLNYQGDYDSVPTEQGIYFIIECIPCPPRGSNEYDAHLRYIGWSDDMQNNIIEQRRVNPDFTDYKTPRHIVCYAQLPDMSREELEQCAYALIYHFKPRDNHEGKQAYTHPPVHIQYECREGAIGAPFMRRVNCDSADICLPESASTELA